MHPENVDPIWFQKLVLNAYEREVEKQIALGKADEAEEIAMWYVFDLRNNLEELYKAGK